MPGAPPPSVSSDDASRVVHSCAVMDDGRRFDALASAFFAPDADRFASMTVDAAAAARLCGDLVEGPDRVVARFVELGRAARRRGFAGLRVAADVTPLLHDDIARVAYRRYEMVIDRVMRAERTLFGLCLVDRSRVDEQCVDDVCHLHERSQPPSDFALFTAPGGHRLAGEIDAANVDALMRALKAVDLTVGARFDVGGCTFLDHRALVALDALARRAGTVIVLEHASSTAARLVRLLELEHVAVLG